MPDHLKTLRQMFIDKVNERLHSEQDLLCITGFMFILQVEQTMDSQEVIEEQARRPLRGRVWPMGWPWSSSNLPIRND